MFFSPRRFSVSCVRFIQEFRILEASNRENIYCHLNKYTFREDDCTILFWSPQSKFAIPRPVITRPVVAARVLIFTWCREQWYSWKTKLAETELKKYFEQKHIFGSSPKINVNLTIKKHTTHKDKNNIVVYLKSASGQCTFFFSFSPALVWAEIVV